MSILQALWLYGHFKRIKTLYAHLVILAEKENISRITVNIYDLSPILPITYAIVNLFYVSQLSSSSH